jgi:hypothetical protein
MMVGDLLSWESGEFRCLIDRDGVTVSTREYEDQVVARDRRLKDERLKRF